MSKSPHKLAPDAKIKRKATMTASSPASSACSSLRASRTSHAPGIRAQSGFEERGHALEKLEFSLAIAEVRGDSARCDVLRSQIANLGGNAEEPGT
jgi:hypothetical protein